MECIDRVNAVIPHADLLRLTSSRTMYSKTYYLDNFEIPMH